MNKIFIVIKREYITRVRKKSFIVMTIAAPLLLVSFYGIIFYFIVNKDVGDSLKKIYVIDQSHQFKGKLTNKETLQFDFGDELPTKGNENKFLTEGDFYAYLLIADSPTTKLSAQLMAIDQPSISTVSYIENQLERVVKEQKLSSLGISELSMKEVNDVAVNIETAKVTEQGSETSNAEVNTAIGYLCAILIYMFIFLYGVQVMRGVIEEKTNRIIEVIISSLKPFELMMGKIIGIALVGLTQFIIWVLLIAILGGSVSGILASQMSLPEGIDQAKQMAGNSGEIGGFLAALGQFDFAMLLGAFLFYFVTGYLFYGALFAAIGSAVDNETDTQQFMLPVTMPLILALVLAQSAVITNPNGMLAVWLSIIPLTSPIAMMVRIPFGVPAWQLILSMIMMIVGFLFTVWLAGRIYRIGILMYGKKPSYKEIGKWLFYKG